MNLITTDMMNNKTYDMETNIQIFSSPQFGQIRTSGTSEQPLFCGVDLASILNFRNAPDALRSVDEEDTQIVRTPTNGGIQEIKFVTESGLYQLILKSNKPEARIFRKWVTSEVLPAIRKHGGYLTQQKVEEALLNPDTLIQLATNLKEEMQRRVLAESKASLLEEVTKEQAPKVLFANAVETSKKSCLVGELAKVLKQNGVDIGQNRLFEWLRQNNYLCSKGEAYNQPTQKAMQLGVFEIKKTTVNKPDGTILVSTTVKVTGKGQIYFVNKFLREV